MAAFIGLDADAVQAVVEKASDAGIVVVANYNSPTQCAVSGEIAGVERAIGLAKEAGAKRALRLQVSGAFHSPLMEKTAHALTDYIGKFERGRLRVSWIANVTGTRVENDKKLIELLSRQLSSPVQWVKSMQVLVEMHRGPIVEVGPGKVLTGLMKRIVPDAAVSPSSDVEALETLSLGS